MWTNSVTDKCYRYTITDDDGVDFWIWDIRYNWIACEEEVNTWIWLVNWWEEQIFSCRWWCCCSHQLLPRPRSVMNCFIPSFDCQMCLLLEVLLLSTDWLITVLKSPPIMIGQLELLEMVEKKVLIKRWIVSIWAINITYCDRAVIDWYINNDKTSFWVCDGRVMRKWDCFVCKNQYPSLFCVIISWEYVSELWWFRFVMVGF